MGNLNSIFEILMRIGGSVYVYCTDFTINLANLTNTSYYEVNFFFFCVLFPLLIFVLPVIAIYLKLKLKRLKRKYEIKHRNNTLA